MSSSTELPAWPELVAKIWQVDPARTDAVPETLLHLHETGLRISERLMALSVENGRGCMDDAVQFMNAISKCKTPAELLEAQMNYWSASVERACNGMARLLETQQAELDGMATKPSVPSAEKPASRAA
jgi:hypothetical protein